jgi:pSer/pThr/pTyr-binding forkhead associated (FHA) protein
LLLTAEGTVVEDLASTNGVYINGTRVRRQPLREGDLLTIGNTEFRFVFKPGT